MPHKLLLADDSVTIQRVIELTFADEDIRVIAVGDGKQAIERIQAERPDIVLADVGMPERDGYEVASFVKGHPELSSVPVLLLTGAFEPIDEARARAAGCDGVLVKPFEPQMVINRVKDLLAGRRPAGLWAAAQVNQPAQPTRTPAPPVDLDLRTQTPGAAAAPGAGNSLDDYFDRLDAAFADLDAAAPPPAAPMSVDLPPPPKRADDGRGHGGDFTTGDVLADWDPELTGDPTRPSRLDRPPVVVAAPPPPPVVRAPEPTPAPPPPLPPSPAHMTPAAPVQPIAPEAPAVTLPQGPSLAEAFAALLAAEQGQPIAPAAIRPSDIPESTIEDIVRRVADRMTGESVRGVVLDIAERLVREEIARIKRG